MSAQPEEWLILGVTQDDEKFHPSDWAERLCGIFATYQNGRLVYSRFAHPVMREGHDFMSVVIEAELKTVSPEIYEFIMGFVKDNQLKMTVGREIVRESDLAETEKFSLKSNILAFNKRLQQFTAQLPTT